MNIGAIITATVVVAAVGLFIGIFLSIAGKKFAVETDEREVAVREALPGNNCGGCGYPGCDGLAAAIAKGEAPVNACPVGGEAVGKAVGVVGIRQIGEMRGQRPAAEEGDRKAREDHAAEQNLHGSEIIGRACLLRAQPQEDDHADEGRDAQHQEDQHRLAHIDLDDVPHGRQQPDIRRRQRRGAEAEQDAVGKAKPDPNSGEQ